MSTTTWSPSPRRLPRTPEYAEEPSVRAEAFEPEPETTEQDEPATRDEPEAEEPAAEPEPAPVESTPEVDDGRPKRTGWWNRRSSFF